MYVIRLEGGKYYVGSSDDPETRFLYHARGEGAAWTRLHRPIEIMEIIPGGGPFEEDKITKEYMAKYGIDNVRGGSYVQIKLRPEDRKVLKRDIWMAQQVCVRCGHPSHYVSDCFARTDVCGDPIEDTEAMSSRTPHERNGGARRYASTESNQQSSSFSRGHTSHSQREPGISPRERWFAEGRCTRCGALSHFSRDCFARRDVNGNHLEEQESSEDTSSSD